MTGQNTIFTTSEHDFDRGAHKFLALHAQGPSHMLFQVSAGSQQGFKVVKQVRFTITDVKQIYILIFMYNWSVTEL